MNRRVLIVDDDESVRSALSGVIESQGYEVVTAANGREALAHFRESPRINVVLLDLNMPVKGGWETLERFTAINPLMPIIVITARPDGYHVAMAAGAAAWMQKPLDIPLLLDQVRKFSSEPIKERLARSLGHSPQTHHST
jgi:two-component system OmpR family response regulator